MKTVWLLSYPRSGNSMLASMALASIDDISFESVYEDKEDEPRFLAEMELLGVHRLPEPRWMLRKTHSMPDVQPQDRVIWLIRDGRDAMTSYWHYWRKINHSQLAPVDFWKTLTGPARDGTRSMWHEHMRHVRDAIMPTDHIVVRYEELVNSPRLAMGSIAQFLHAHFDGNRLEKVSFDKLQSLTPWFYRKGKIGSYVELPELALEWLNSRLHGELKRFGYLDEPWQDAFKGGAGI